ncbi:response regulator [Tropicimonas aquimaris]|uniref:Response regulator n=1 Tax=Tropicimonas aquimaris TaxID=914152 RepID=A0ABW3IVF1_9RHOB
MSKHILVVDDDRQITDLLERFLKKQGFRVATAGSATQMGLLMEHRDFDLLILDVGLPDIDGFQVTRELRKTSAMPIIMLTVRDEVYDKIIGLEVGADDYVAKPFEPRELLARMRAVLRRTESAPALLGLAGGARQVTFSGFELNMDTQKVRCGRGNDVPLTSSEFTLLAALVQKAGQVVTRDQLMDLLYAGSIHVTDRAVDAHIARVRRKLTLAGNDGELIKTVHGQGYCLASEVHVGSE